MADRRKLETHQKQILPDLTPLVLRAMPETANLRTVPKRGGSITLYQILVIASPFFGPYKDLYLDPDAGKYYIRIQLPENER